MRKPVSGNSIRRNIADFFSAGNELNALEKVVFSTWDEEKVANRPVNEFLWSQNL